MNRADELKVKLKQKEEKIRKLEEECETLKKQIHQAQISEIQMTVQEIGISLGDVPEIIRTVLMRREDEMNEDAGSTANALRSADR